MSAAGTPAQGTGMRWRRSSGWRPGELGWRVAWLFMVGSTLFAVGAFPVYAQFVDGRIVGITFVVGSIFFTAAGYSQFLQVINDPPAPGSRFRLFAWQPQRMLWWAVAIQLAGTLYFNVDTVDALIQGLTAQRENRLVWAPDFFGSIAFLVASHLAWLDVCGGTFWRARTDSADWWSSGANYLGSVFFMASAIASFTVPTTDEMLNLTLVNSGTCAGALCFLFGAYLLLPARGPAQPS